MESQRRDITVIDGGFATQLCTHVAEPIDGNPLWSARFLATHPRQVLQTHLDFLRAGAVGIMTNTYQASVNGFMKYLGLTEQESVDLIKTAVALAKEARNKYVEENVDAEPLIIGSVGPYGASLHDYSEYSGDYVDSVGRQRLADWHRPRVRALVDAGVHLLAFETIPARAEAQALVELLKEFPRQKAWISFSCRDENHISHGEIFQEVAQDIWDSSSQLVAVGVNCLNPKWISTLMRGINKNRHNNPIPLVVYPNSGEKFDTERAEWVDADKCRSVSDFVHEWLDLGVKFVGGCCRTNAHDIRKICAEVNAWTSSKDKNLKTNGYA